ncbi:MAG TPA: tRNA pseudouridine(38-40) synthase TruA [Gemmatimonadales bacterium]|nr:tRNA pseudouridine(38-40) synthase TruA [Gemmatimonadales bacterium]
MSRTYLALLHYDGRAFAGWQRQPEGRTVQAEFEGVLERLLGRRVPVHAAGRTDAGVHAIGMGVSLTVPEAWNAERLCRALNALLPGDCWVDRVCAMTPGFHARKSATGRRYRYDIGTDATSLSPFRRPYEWALGRELDRPLLDRSAAAVLGEHDFEAFAVRRPEGRDPRPFRCAVREARWEVRDGDQGVRLHIAADRFLHHMVRFLVGTMVDIALHRRPADDMQKLLVSHDNQDTSPPAPPQGLYFVAADYPATCFLEAAVVAAPPERRVLAREGQR